MLVLDRVRRTIRDAHISDLPEFLQAGDRLVLNNSRVLPAKFLLHRATGGRIEGLFLEQRGDGAWHVMLRNAARLRVGEQLHFVANPAAWRVEVLEKGDRGEWYLRVTPGNSPEKGRATSSATMPTGGGMDHAAPLKAAAEPENPVNDVDPDAASADGSNASAAETTGAAANADEAATDGPSTADDATKASGDCGDRAGRGAAEEGAASTAVLDAASVLRDVGRMPLPPYIRRERESDERDAFDRERYQTTFAARDGSVAAPTAGLHFTPELLAKLEDAGVARSTLTLHVGMGTFLPVTVEDLADHVMHFEQYEVDAETGAEVAATKQTGGRLVAVGTTCTRVLETIVRSGASSQSAGDAAESPECSAEQEGGNAETAGQRILGNLGRAHVGATNLFCYPPYEFGAVDVLLTNFHLPGSTLLALVMAFAGEDFVREAYEHAVRERYRFFSYGDAMLIV